MSALPIAAKRIYQDVAAGDGYRVLVDRLWPRGLRKTDAAFARWAKDVAPSADLRKWYGHDPARFPEFRERYRAELHQPPAAAIVEELREKAQYGPVTLLTATKDLDRSGAEVLKEFLLADE